MMRIGRVSLIGWKPNIIRNPFLKKSLDFVLVGQQRIGVIKVLIVGYHFFGQSSCFPLKTLIVNVRSSHLKSCLFDRLLLIVKTKNL